MNENESSAQALTPTDDPSPGAEQPAAPPQAPSEALPAGMQHCRCPSGLAGHVGPLRTEHASILADQRALRTGKAADQVLRSIWHRTLDTGPYRRAQSHGGIDWPGVLVADRMVALLYGRIATYGNTESLDLVCPACRKKFVWDLPLDEFIDENFRALPQSSIDMIARGENRIEVTLASGAAVAFKLTTGRDQSKITKAIRERTDEIVTASLLTRIIEVDGVDPRGDGVKDWINAQPMGVVQELIDVFDEHDGGVDTLIDVYCNTCGHEWGLDLPLDLQRMFAPKRSGRRRKRGRKGTR